MFAARSQAQMFRHLASGTVTQTRHFTSCNCICGRCLSMLQTARPTMGCHLTILFRQCVTECANCRRRADLVKAQKPELKIHEVFLCLAPDLGSELQGGWPSPPPASPSDSLSPGSQLQSLQIAYGNIWAKKWQPLQRQNLELWTSFVFAVFGRWGTARSILCPEALQDAIQSWLNCWQQFLRQVFTLLLTTIH